MAGERRQFFYVEFDERKDHELPNGRKIKISAPKFYIRKDKFGIKPHEASHLTEQLANQIAERYQRRSPIVQSDSEHIFESTPNLLAELHEVGEEDQPLPNFNSDIEEFEFAVEKALTKLTRTEVFAAFGRKFVEET